jgi:ribonucleoside-diphosphate reductase alpha chain
MEQQANPMELSVGGHTKAYLNALDGNSPAVLKAGSGEEQLSPVKIETEYPLGELGQDEALLINGVLYRPATVGVDPAVAGGDWTGYSILQPFIAQRPDSLRGNSYRQATPLGTAYISINHDPHDSAEEPLEVFIDLGKAGSEAKAVAEALGRAISFSLRLTAPMDRLDRLEEIAKQFIGIGGGNGLGIGPKRVNSLPDAVGKALMLEVERVKSLRGKEASMERIPNFAKESSPGERRMVQRSGDVTAIPTKARTPDELFMEQEQRYADEAKDYAERQRAYQARQVQSANAGPQASAADLCPDCGNASLIQSEGCATCHVCGYSKC